MSEDSKIEWTDNTFNPWEGCAKVSPGCAHCYAENRNARWNGTAINWGKGAPRRRTSVANWQKPIKWNSDASKIIARIKADIGNASEYNDIDYSRPRVFCASLADWLDDEVPIAWLADLLKLIRDTPNLDWLLLSKRLQNWRQRIEAAQDWHFDCGDRNVTGWLQDWWKHGIAPANAWVGTTVEDQKRADERIPILLSIQAKVRFLSCEPMLEPLDVGTWFFSAMNDAGKCAVDWVICGGESGPSSRPMHGYWARDLHGQCAQAGVAFFMKQMGGKRKPFMPIPNDLMIREFPTGKAGA